MQQEENTHGLNKSSNVRSSTFNSRKQSGKQNSANPGSSPRLRLLSTSESSV